ncbi:MULTISPECIES: sugar phosphate isomerase/epimerase family protein [Haloarcula]|uniref:Xylose isomerase n=1 Tax=Haloarcula pellucida TaxID=1427151 RepID=A0A830GJ12_9EURY|nr:MULTISPECIES: sugar phosphate isomerase/epimerase family protein [Halomicroarcula]MBX0347567.1 sugar phosphate isomerase/epimerase [Halomicroarcula pellucida]MDS0276513.1 sugar phosphate isomerase/epimerase [Halomicroarcula sp. S1AR25-4]GGN89337.1 xylose isomerase [Halomicroarcula pellucida]
MSPNRTAASDLTLDLELGFTLGLGLDFERAVAWAADEGFDFVELLLDGPYARERIVDRRAQMAGTLADHGLDVVVHLPFAVDLGSPFTPVREGAVTELTAGMDLAADLGAERVVFHPSSDAWDLGWTESDCRGFVHESLNDLVPAAQKRDLNPCLENVVNSYYDAASFPELLERYPDASMTFDTSHAILTGMDESEMGEFTERYADRIDHLHLVDTRGGSDEHLPVGMGRLDFTRALSGLADAGWSGTATLEIGTEDYGVIALGKSNTEALLSTR